jgi:hypothetical protein
VIKVLKIIFVVTLIVAAIVFMKSGATINNCYNSALNNIIVSTLSMNLDPDKICRDNWTTFKAMEQCVVSASIENPIAEQVVKFNSLLPSKWNVTNAVKNHDKNCPYYPANTFLQ